MVDLDGQEFRFDDGWRMTGSGTWSLSEPGSHQGGNTVGDGSVVHVVVKPSVDGIGNDAEETESPSSVPSDPASAATRTAPPPEEAAWDLSVIKNKSGKLEFFFLTSDPDVRDKYYLSRR
ncbi:MULTISPECIES: hypothetical protein [unclassified Streptomyces]|uniref:hypothetical protein n=1 Tax=unclassified Streptomyces TaxID=2593676 RepID=UPI0037A13AE8